MTSNDEQKKTHKHQLGKVYYVNKKSIQLCKLVNLYDNGRTHVNRKKFH